MMEEAQAGHDHSNSIFIARFDDIVIADRTAGLSDVIDAAAMSAFDVIAKGEESVAAKGYAVELSNPGLLFFPRKGLRFSVKRSCQMPSANTSS